MNKGGGTKLEPIVLRYKGEQIPLPDNPPEEPSTYMNIEVYTNPFEDNPFELEYNSYNGTGWRKYNDVATIYDLKYLKSGYYFMKFIGNWQDNENNYYIGSTEMSKVYISNPAHIVIDLPEDQVTTEPIQEKKNS